jgi:hypothetical protein
VIRQTASLLDTAGGGSNLALKGGIHA